MASFLRTCNAQEPAGTRAACCPQYGARGGQAWCVGRVGGPGVMRTVPVSPHVALTFPGSTPAGTWESVPSPAPLTPADSLPGAAAAGGHRGLLAGALGLWPHPALHRGLPLPPVAAQPFPGLSFASGPGLVRAHSVHCPPPSVQGQTMLPSSEPVPVAHPHRVLPPDCLTSPPSCASSSLASPDARFFLGRP